MWTVNDNQITALSDLMRNKFVRRACFAIEKEHSTLSESEISRIVHTQTDKIVAYDMEQEEMKMQFVRLSFEYPILQAETLPEDLHQILSSYDIKAKEDTRIENLIKQLNNNNYEQRI
jgi:mRNA-degrading endonuclease YafQ of YafQ-DinJ toxin-antitoxin module